MIKDFFKFIINVNRYRAIDFCFANLKSDNTLISVNPFPC
jgi:hypothetical protein